MPYDPQRVESHIADILNAVPSGWWDGVAGNLKDAKRSPEAIENARIQSGWEVLTAIATNPQGGYFGSLTTLVTVAHNAFLPAHEGEVGIPVIVPFSGAPAIEGYPATPNEIDGYRADPNDSHYTGAHDGVRVAHDAADANGIASVISGRYSIVNGRLKFTGLSAQVPMIQLTRSMADTGVPEVFEPTVVKLSIPKLIKEGDLLAVLASGYSQLGHQDLETIRRGALNVPPLPAVQLAQKMGAT